VETPVFYHYHPLVGSTSGLRETLIGSPAPLAAAIKSVVRRFPSPVLEWLGRPSFTTSAERQRSRAVPKW